MYTPTCHSSHHRPEAREQDRQGTHLVNYDVPIFPEMPFESPQPEEPFEPEVPEEPAELLEPPRKKAKKKTARPPPEQYPFPATHDEVEELPRSPSKRVPQMRTTKARDGGRTQSGGVRGIPADDIDDI